jgi:hypothetical protein
MIVFGVCALGVGSLYLVPSIARSPEQIGVPKATDVPASQPVQAEPDTSPQSASPNKGRDSVAGSDDDRSATQPTTKPSTEAPERPDGDKDPTTRKATDQPKNPKDSQPPEPVAGIEPSAVTEDRLSLKWRASDDNVGVVGYRIWLNGFEVATTAETWAKLHWFNDDSRQHVVQIRAVDAAGNQSRSSPTLVVTRPSPEPTPTPTPSDSPTPSAEPDTESDLPTTKSTGRESEAERKNR